MPERKPDRMLATLTAKQSALYECSQKVDQLMRMMRLNEQTLSLAIQSKLESSNISEADKVKILQMAEILPKVQSGAVTHQLEIVPSGSNEHYHDDDAMDVDQGHSHGYQAQSTQKIHNPQEKRQQRKLRVKQTAAASASPAVGKEKATSKATGSRKIHDADAAKKLMDEVIRSSGADDDLEDIDVINAQKYLEEAIQGEGAEQDEPNEEADDDANDGEYDEEQQHEEEYYDEEENAEEQPTYDKDDTSPEAMFARWKEKNQTAQEDDDVGDDYY